VKVTSSRDARLAALHRQRAAIDLEIAALLDGGEDGPSLAKTVPDELLTVAEAAPLLRMTTNSVYSLIAEKKLPVVRLSSRRLRLRKAALISWLDRQETAPRKRKAFG
jgi:excisionase family DNA binding protein